MTTQPFYNTGTAVLTNGSTAMVGTGTFWAGNIRAFDRVVGKDGKEAIVASVTDNTHIVLMRPWQGTTQATDVYEIWMSPDEIFLQTLTRQIFETLASSGLVEIGELITTIDPIVILSTGQSNTSNRLAYTWTPETNLFLWNFDGSVTDPSIPGTSFDAMTPAAIAYSYSYANEIAKANPLRKVYLINVGAGGVPISKWMVGAIGPDMYTACKVNIEAALSALGISTIHKFLWWQGEADAVAGSTTYIADFNTVIARFRAETWFPITTPITIMGICALAGAPRSTFNINLAALAADEPDVRKYVHTPFLPAAYWNADNSHMLAPGYEQAGKLAYFAERAVNQKFYVDPENGNVVISQNAGKLPVPIAGTMLQIGNADENGSRLLIDAFGIASSILSFRRSRGTALAPSAIQSGDQLLNIGAFGYGATAYSTMRAGFFASAAENWTDAAQGTYLDILTTATGAAAARVVATFKADASTALTGLLDLSAATAGQIKFPAMQVPSSDANTLDDYEEGTFTPTLSFGGASVGITYSTQVGKYTKVGNVVTPPGSILLSNKGSSVGTAIIGGLPFTVASGQDVPCSIRANNMAASTITDIQPLFLGGTTTINIGRYAAGVVALLADTDFTNTSVLRISGSYLT